MLPELSPKVVDLIEKVSKFMDENIYPNEDKIEAEINTYEQQKEVID